MEQKEIYEELRKNAFGNSDYELFDTMEEVIDCLLAGNMIFLVDGFDKGMKIPDKGYPGLGIVEPDSEKAIRGSREGFCESVKTNTSLIRKRLRTKDLKVEELSVGVRSHTGVNVMYMEGIARPEVLEEVKQRLKQYEVDGVLDSGVLEQLAEKTWYSPFPQFQTTQRPDRAAMALLEGRVVILSDHSPTGLIVPTDYNSLLKTCDDYYNSFWIVTLERILRYMAAFFAMTLPGLYLAVTNFHTQILPTSLLLSFAAAREGVPFPAVVEVLLMELSFELLREAGVRLPGAMGNTIGIVGGLIIGQAAVEANLVSPIIVIVVAFTALCSFAIPCEELSAAFRVIKFLYIWLCAWLGFYGFLYASALVLLHMAHLKSFGVPYLMPFCGADVTKYADERDSIVRLPLFLLKYRPIYARKEQRRRIKRKR